MVSASCRRLLVIDGHVIVSKRHEYRYCFGRRQYAFGSRRRPWDALAQGWRGIPLLELFTMILTVHYSGPMYSVVMFVLALWLQTVKFTSAMSWVIVATHIYCHLNCDSVTRGFVVFSCGLPSQVCDLFFPRRKSAKLCFSLQAKNTTAAGAEFLLIFDSGSFSEDSTFLLTVSLFVSHVIPYLNMTNRTGWPTRPRKLSQRTSRWMYQRLIIFHLRNYTSSPVGVYRFWPSSRKFMSR